VITEDAYKQRRVLIHPSAWKRNSTKFDVAISEHRHVAKPNISRRLNSAQKRRIRAWITVLSYGWLTPASKRTNEKRCSAPLLRWPSEGATPATCAWLWSDGSPDGDLARAAGELDLVAVGGLFVAVALELDFAAKGVEALLVER
jgi:hypothetical protein